MSVRVLWVAICVALVWNTTRTAKAEDDEAFIALKTLAHNEIDGEFVEYTQPYKAVDDDSLSFNFGHVTAFGKPEIVLQLRVELLRRFPLFGEPETAQTITDLEEIVREYQKIQQQLAKAVASRATPDSPLPAEYELEGKIRDQGMDLEFAFEDALRKHALEFAERNHLSLGIGDAFADSDYLYIDQKCWHRRDVSFKKPSKAVTEQFNQDRFDFARPHMVVEHSRKWQMDKGRDAARFELGNIYGLNGNDSLASDMFYLELLRRYPNVEMDLLAKHVPTIETTLRGDWIKQAPLSRRESMRRTSLQHLLHDMYNESAKAVGLDLYYPPAPAGLGTVEQ